MREWRIQPNWVGCEKKDPSEAQWDNNDALGLMSEFQCLPETSYIMPNCRVIAHLKIFAGVGYTCTLQ